jgi:hypothetical protein
MTSTTDTPTTDDNELEPLPAWVNLQAIPGANQREINLRTTLGRRGRALLPLVCVWVRDAYSAEEWPDLESIDDGSIGDLIRSHMGYDGVDEVLVTLHRLMSVFGVRAQERDQEMDALRAERPDLFGPDDNDPDRPTPEWSNDAAVAKNLLESHGFAVTVHGGAS